jgi:hypothetical protein
MGTEEEPDQQSCQRYEQLRPEYLGYFEGELRRVGGRVLGFKEGEVIVCM